ncbi:MAG TPA: Rieske 2Fe-2S domain-containing protein [Terricaulis sp.]|jgi:Phenylpropionate dioxygenase and related ring-hydroxylating dioxygenases, large terminal subunit|nr:Rieske 2Fe-2S domain-containing protein [Terricaulis sp.]
MSMENDVPILEDIPDAVGFPYTVMPTGWFQVGWSHELKAGDVRALKYFKQQQVMYRGEDGQAVVMSAFCAHFGAHLAHGGRVEGCNIVCPYHGWTWGPDGRNIMAPSEGKASEARRRIKRYPTVETCGIIWVWHDALNRDPLWPAPKEERGGDKKYLPINEHTAYGWTNVSAQPQYVTENLVDIDHFIYVHKNTFISPQRSESDYPELDLDGPIAYVKAKPPRATAEAHGVGAMVVRVPDFPGKPWRFPAIVFSNTTPIDNEKSDMFGCVLVEQDMNAEGCEGDAPVGSALKRVEEQKFQQQADFEIWANMVYMRRPAYGRFEGKYFLKMRRWAEQFYPEAQAAGKAG